MRISEKGKKSEDEKKKVEREDTTVTLRVLKQIK